MLHAYYFDDDLYKNGNAVRKKMRYGFLISITAMASQRVGIKVSGVWQWFGDVSISSDEDYTWGFTPHANKLMI